MHTESIQMGAQTICKLELYGKSVQLNGGGCHFFKAVMKLVFLFSCWLKDDVVFYVSVVVYFCGIFLANVIMFVVVMVQLRRIKRQNPQNNQHHKGLQDLRSIAGLTVLLGLTWGFAFFAWGLVYIPFTYLFTIFNSFQGESYQHLVLVWVSMQEAWLTVCSFYFQRFFHLHISLCGKRERPETMENLPLLWQVQTSRKLRYYFWHSHANQYLVASCTTTHFPYTS